MISIQKAWNQLPVNQKKALIQGCIITLIALLTSITIATSSLGRFLSGLTLDQLIRSSTPIQENRIVLIDITEDDYRDLFGQRRPLNPSIIMELITGAHNGGAKLIAVDISTTDWPKDWETHVTRPPAGTRVVWARSFYLDRKLQGAQYVMEPLLGGISNADRECYGIPALREDAGILRWFYSNLQIGSRHESSFVNAIIYRQDHGSCLTADLDNELEELCIIDFSSKIPVETASTLLKQSRLQNWGPRPEYAEKIVIIGGTFHSGSDIHETPVGFLSGLEINGQAVSSVLRSKVRRELSNRASVLIDIAIGIILLIVGIFGARAQFLTTLFALALCIVLSLYIFHQYYLFISFLPIVTGIMAHLYLARLHREKYEHS